MTKKSVDYGTLSDELDTIIESIQSRDIDVDAAVKQFKRGMKIINELEQYLKTAKNDVETVKKSFL